MVLYKDSSNVLSWLEGGGEPTAIVPPETMKPRVDPGDGLEEDGQRDLQSI